MVRFKAIKDLQQESVMSAFWRKDERTQLIANFIDVARRVGADSHMLAVRSEET
jgi:hypothetical protein